MTIILHTGARNVTYNELVSTPTPHPTATHIPISHALMVTRLKTIMQRHDLRVDEEHYGLSKDGSEMFGLFSLDPEDDEWAPTVGFRNSHSKKFAAGVAIGNRVFVCDNLAFIGEVTIKRKHTKNVLNSLIDDTMLAFDNVQAKFAHQRRMITQMKETFATHNRLNSAVARMVAFTHVSKPIMNKMVDTFYDWDNPTLRCHESMWDVFNYVTSETSGQAFNDFKSHRETLMTQFYEASVA